MVVLAGSVTILIAGESEVTVVVFAANVVVDVTVVGTLTVVN